MHVADACGKKLPCLSMIHTNKQQEQVQEIGLTSIGDAKKLSSNTKSIAKKAGGAHSKSKRSTCCSCCPCGCCSCLAKCKLIKQIGDIFSKCRQWYKFHFGEDTRNWFVLLMIRELIEILVQIVAAYNYNGFDMFNTNNTILGYKEYEIKLFCMSLSLNCIITGILWLFYLFCHNLCHGVFFKQIIFLTDTIFDTFYALFPIIIVTNQSGYSSQLAVSVLQTTTTYDIFVALVFFSKPPPKTVA